MAPVRRDPGQEPLSCCPSQTSGNLKLVWSDQEMMKEFRHGEVVEGVVAEGVVELLGTKAEAREGNG